MIYNHFSSSSKRQYAFKGIQSILDLQNYKILRPLQTRWLSIVAVIERLLEQWDALILYFNHLNSDEECKKLKKKKKNVGNKQTIEEENESEIVKINNYLQDPTIKLYYYFLLWILPKFTGLNKLFQSDKPLIAVIHKKMTVTYLDLLKTYMDSDYVNKTSLSHINPSDESRFMNIHNIYVSIDAFNYFNKPKFVKLPLPENKIEFLTNCRNFMVRGCQEIKKKI